MDARPLRFALTLGAWLIATSFASAANWKTDNFVVTAPTEDLAKKVAFTAERWRIRLAKEWLGRTLPKWYRPCPISVKVGQIGAGGATTFRFSQGQVFGWQMNVQGTEDRILDSVIPHEVSHTVFASHFRRGLPRWADEGAATLAEHESEQRRQAMHLKQVWNTSHKIPLDSLLSMEEYPTDMRDVMTLYAQGYSLADFLVQKGGKARYLKLLDLAEKKDWETALREIYGIEGVSSLDSSWGNWVVAGSPPLDKDRMLAAVEPSEAHPRSDEVIRGQTPDADSSSEFDEFAEASQEPVKTASLDEDFQGFLPPQSLETRTVATATKALSGGKEPRPAPLCTFLGRETTGPRSSGATETSRRNSQEGRRALPVTSRVEPTAEASSIRDFFASESNERTGAPKRTLGMNDFPTASAF
ncbi:MAG: hypothetical protein M3552_02385 [Planctomycetota bacterium]|nr:hypothetical protein [Planctomycetaceae bacterium]MDQ3329494.1 hypothetical protein [Planctomycetota bacterium]